MKDPSSTQPLTSTPELWRVSAFRRAMSELAGLDVAGATHNASALTSLSPSLAADLQRFQHTPGGAELLDVTAACLRHAQNVAIHLSRDGFVVPITIFPRERLYHSPMPPAKLMREGLQRVKLLQVEPAILRPPGNRRQELIGDRESYHPLAPLLWGLALRGPRTELLTELAGAAVYRVAPGLSLQDLDLEEPMVKALLRLRSESAALHRIATWPGLDAESAQRLLNAIYLQSGLIISRTHPDALTSQTLGQSWRQFLRRRKDGGK